MLDESFWREKNFERQWTNFGDDEHQLVVCGSKLKLKINKLAHVTRTFDCKTSDTGVMFYSFWTKKIAHKID